MIKWEPMLLLAIGVLLSTGCTHMQLRQNTIHQASTISDIHQQQVMDNLAMFVYDPYSLPLYAYPTQGTNDVTDSAQAGMMVQWLRNGFNAGSLSSQGSRTQKENWTLTPINDPRKLELMRCAYQKAVSSCDCCGYVSRSCPDCEKRFNVFYTGKTHKKTLMDCPEGAVCADDKQCVLTTHDVIPFPGDFVKDSGEVTSNCIGQWCWFGVGCKKDVPKCCPCNYVGHYCGVYVWVLPEGRDELAKLTLAILDYATNDPPAARLKQVKFQIDKDGLPANAEDKIVGSVTAMVPIGTKNLEILKQDCVDMELTTLNEASIYNYLADNNAVLDAKQLKIISEAIKRANGDPLAFRNDKEMIDAIEKIVNKTKLEDGSNFVGLDATMVLDRAIETMVTRLPPISPEARTLPPRRTPTPGGGLLLLEQRLETVR